MNEAAANVPEGHSFEKDEVLKIINSVVAKVEANETVSRDNILQEVSDLQKVIIEARAEIASTRPGDIGGKHIPTATDELDAIVEATAKATGDIMDCCDVIQEKSTDDEVNNQIMKIYEACSFQDITGQRITKVVKTLQVIEEKVDSIIGIIGGAGAKGGAGEGAAGGEDTRTGDDKLLNGPQMADKAITQDDIDSILAEFD